MPGPVSDSYDSEFGTGANADDVRQAVKSVSEYVGSLLGPALADIVEVAEGEPGKKLQITLSERQLRLIRFACNRAVESI